LTIFWIVLIEADLISHSNGEEVFFIVRECPNICDFVVWKVSHECNPMEAIILEKSMDFLASISSALAQLKVSAKLV
jgi:hypothetical protein